MPNYKDIATGAEKGLTAQEVYDLTSQVVQETFRLDMEGSPYEVQDIWDVIIAASVERISIESGCDLLDEAPCANTVRTALSSLFSDEGLEQLEHQVNHLLVARLPKKLLKKPRLAAIDITEIPYHGEHDDEDERVRRGRAKSGTTHFHSFGTLVILHRNKRYTMAITLMRKSDKALDVLKRLLKQGKKSGLRFKRLYLDRGFDNNAVIAYLKRQSFPSIIALAIRGKTGGTRALCKGRKGYQVRYRRESKLYGRQSLPLFIVCKYSKGRYRRKGVKYFAYVVIGILKMPPHQVYEEYRRRFGIETSYRMMNTMRARTSSRSAALRLFFVAIALLLLNLWVYVKWQILFRPHPGPRQILHHLLPLARWRLWLWEMVKQRLGFSLEIVLSWEV